MVRSFESDSNCPNFPQNHFAISGVTKDSAGTALVGCTVNLFETATELFRASVVSDANGAFSFPVNGDRAFFLNGYKTGSPDVAGTTLNTLLGTVPTASASTPFSWHASKFDGNTYLTHSGFLGSIAASQLGLFSFWLKMDPTSNDAVDYDVLLIGSTNNVVRIFRNGTGSGGIRIIAKNVSLGDLIDIASTTTALTAAGGWHHIMISFDLSAAGNKAIYINGVIQALNVNTYGSGANDPSHQVGYATDADCEIGLAGDSKMFGSLSELYFQVPATYFTQVSSFYSAAGPVNLGSDGSRPTGSNAFIYLPNSFASFGTNSGSGGDFSITAGSLADDASIPP